MGFDFDSETRRQLGYRLIDRIDGYFSGLAQRPVQLPEEHRSFADLGEPLPEFGDDAAKVLDNLCSEMVAQGFHVPSANYFGLMNPTPTYMAVLAEALVAALNPQLASLARSQLASRIERETVRWIGGRVGWDKPFDGTFTSGGGVPIKGNSGPLLGDFNGDGKLDVLEQGTGTLLVLLGNGDGSFQAPIRTPSGASLLAVGAVDQQ